MEQDVYVVIQGYDHPSQQGKPAGCADEDLAIVNATSASAKYLKSHPPLKVICFTGGDNPDPSADILTKIEQARAANPGGKVLLAGGSAGGKNVLKVAAALTAKNVPIGFIGLWDAAFDRPDRTELLKKPGVKAERMINWYQTFSESLDDEKVQEIHDEVAGFQNIQLDYYPPMLMVRASYLATGICSLTGWIRQKFWDMGHTTAYQFARDASRWHVRNVLIGS